MVHLGMKVLKCRVPFRPSIVTASGWRGPRLGGEGLGRAFSYKWAFGVCVLVLSLPLTAVPNRYRYCWCLWMPPTAIGALAQLVNMCQFLLGFYMIWGVFYLLCFGGFSVGINGMVVKGPMEPKGFAASRHSLGSTWLVISWRLLLLFLDLIVKLWLGFLTRLGDLFNAEN